VGVSTGLNVREQSPAKASTPPAKASTPPAKASTPPAKASTPLVITVKTTPYLIPEVPLSKVITVATAFSAVTPYRFSELS